MNIRIKRGTGLATALKEVCSIFDPYMDEYPYLWVDMRISLSLKSVEDNVSRLNNKDFYYDGNRMIDTIKERIDQGKKALLQRINIEVNSLRKTVNKAEAELERYRKNLRSAEENGFSTAEDWRNKISYLKSKIDGEFTHKVNSCKYIKQCLDAGDLEFYVQPESDSPKKIKPIRILLVIDPKSRILYHPLYYVPGMITSEEPALCEWFEV